MPDTSNPSWNGEPEADHQLGDLLEHDLDITWEQEIARRKKAWKSKEVEFRTHASVDRSNLHQDSNSSHYPEQIFTEALTLFSSCPYLGMLYLTITPPATAGRFGDFLS